MCTLVEELSNCYSYFSRLSGFPDLFGKCSWSFFKVTNPHRLNMRLMDFILFSQFHDGRDISHGFISSLSQLWQLVYSEVSSTKTTMYQKYALSHNIKVCILKMSVTYIMSSACSSDQLPYALPVADQIQLRNRSMRFVLNTHAHKSIQIFLHFVKIMNSNVFFIKGNLDTELHNP